MSNVYMWMRLQTVLWSVLSEDGLVLAEPAQVQTKPHIQEYEKQNIASSLGSKLQYMLNKERQAFYIHI